MKPNTPLTLGDQKTSTKNSPGTADASHPAQADGSGQALDWQDLRPWFHQPRFNQCDGLDDYDGDYREFDPLGEVVTAHLRHRLQRSAEETPHDRRASTTDPCRETPSRRPTSETQCRQPATDRPEPHGPRTDNGTENENFRFLSRMLNGVRRAAVSGAREVCAVFSHAPLPPDCLHRISKRLPEAVLVVNDRLPAIPGPEAWLGALAMGACRVILFGPENTPDQGDALRMARAVLGSLHLDPGSRLLSLVDGSAVERIGPSPAPVPSAPVAWEPAGNERDLLWQAAVHLHNQVPGAPDQAALDPGAPFGAVSLDTSCCTLCMACVGACPTRALRHGSPGPQILFRERDCTQCGRCRQVCPEQAVTLTPRICYDLRLIETARILHREAPLCCSVCGTPFATAGIVDAVTRRLAAHRMYQDPAARERLTMCRDCRIRAYFSSAHPRSHRRGAGRKA